MKNKKDFWTGIGVMIGTVVLVCLLTFLISGCALLEDNKETIKEQIIVYLQNQAIESAQDYVDGLVADGKLSPEQREELMSAIPHGVEKVREALEK